MQARHAFPMFVGIATLTTGAAFAADPATLNWDTVPKTEITLFYPGQSTMQWMLSASHKAGATAVAEGRSCVSCHEGEEADIGNAIVSGELLEPAPISGKPGTVPLTIQAAYDAEYFYLKASWPAKEAGIFHQYRIYRDGKWETYASHRGSQDVRDGKIKASYEDRFAVMLGDNQGRVAGFENHGCWVTCHSSMRDMPNEPGRDSVQAHPILGKDGMKLNDIRKYLLESRTGTDEAGGWDKVKDRAALDAVKASGAYLDLWQWRGNRSHPIGYSDDSFVLEYRNADAGKSMFTGNWDGAKGHPRFMLDPAKNDGAVALTEAEFRDPNAPFPTDRNTIPFDPNHAWKDGDLMPSHVLITEPEGSRAALTSSGTHADDRWTITMRRKLDTGFGDDVALVSGQTFPIGFAVHDDNVTTRFHHVSFPLTISLGTGEGQIHAVELK